VREAALRISVRAPATVNARPGGEAVVATPAAGRLVAARLPSIGERVAAGAALARLEPRSSTGVDRATLAAAVTEARLALEAARIEQGRAEKLLADQAVPARRVDEARRAAEVAEARLKAAEAALAQKDETLRTGGGTAAGNAFTVRAPIAGRITEITATLGASYEEGTPLFKIVRTDSVELQAHVPAQQADIARRLTAVSFEAAGAPAPIVLQFDRAHDPGVLDPTTKALPLQLHVDNKGGQLLVGQTGTAILYTNAQQPFPVVPAESVLMEAGRAYVFVQAGGETFVRRFIEIATRDADLVGVKNGVKAGERVVSRGAYEVQLASAAKGLPPEGHVH
jgi:RND family efflux transporter MFP subunit